MSREHRIDLQESENFFGRQRVLRKVKETHKFSPEPKWKTKEGYTVFIKDMSESHIKNSINMLKRNIPPTYENSGMCSTIPDSADFALAQDYEDFRQPYLNQIKILENELARRNKNKKTVAKK